MKYFWGLILILISGLLYWYMLVPDTDFPTPPSGAFQSSEPGDSEDLAGRRAYFTNFTREEVVGHYQDQFSFLPSLRLNYPPEEAQTIIRDLTRSTYLEEIAHPLRESIYINGFEPREPKDDIWYKGAHYEQKITVRYVQSSMFARFAIATMVLVVGAWTFLEYKLLFRING